MRYAFVGATIFTIWVALIMIGIVTGHQNIAFLHYTALTMTVVMFFFGFRGR